MLEKLLNPFNIKVTSATSAFVWTGTLVSGALHVAFYATVAHFIVKFW